MTLNSNHDILLAGAFAAFTVDILVYPLDTLKTRVQSPQYAALYKSRAKRPSPALFRGLYQGIGSVVVATIPSSGAFFTTYEGMKRMLSSLSSSTTSPISVALPTPILHSCASGVAEMVSCAILTPAEVIKQNAQVVHTSSSSGSSSHPVGSGRSRAYLSSSMTWKVLARMRSHPSRLWSGYAALVARNLPFTGLQFPLYEALKVQTMEWQRAGRPDSTTADGAQPRALRYACTTAFSAAIAGSIAATVTTPIDVLKTRIMLDAGEEQGNAKEGKQRGSLQSPRKTKPTTLWMVGKDVYEKEGVAGLFRGGALRAGWTVIGLGLYLGSYEGGRMVLESRRERKQANNQIDY